MSVLVWVMTGIAIWHFAVFVPDRFWGGIVGAFLAAMIGALVIGAVFHLASGGDIDDTGVRTLVEGAIGGVAGLASAWIVGMRRGEEPID